MKCRHCKAPAQSSNFLGEFIEKQYLFKCKTKKCGRFYWHRRILSEFDMHDPYSSENKIKENELCEDLKIPNHLESRSVYVIKLSRSEGEKTDTVYVGETGRHPLRRYLQHLRGYKSGKKYVKNRGKYLLSLESGLKTVEESRKREKELASELVEEYLVVGGH